MTIERVKNAAYLRNIYFDGVKKWRNNMAGYAYEIYTPGGRGFFQSDTLTGLYKKIMEYPKTN
jgi:hypothetical protein